MAANAEVDQEVAMVEQFLEITPAIGGAEMFPLGPIPVHGLPFRIALTCIGPPPFAGPSADLEFQGSRHFHDPAHRLRARVGAPARVGPDVDHVEPKAGRIRAAFQPRFGQVGGERHIGGHPLRRFDVGAGEGSEGECLFGLFLATAPFGPVIGVLGRLEDALGRPEDAAPHLTWIGQSDAMALVGLALANRLYWIADCESANPAVQSHVGRQLEDQRRLVPRIDAAEGDGGRETLERGGFGFGPLDQQKAGLVGRQARDLGQPGRNRADGAGGFLLQALRRRGPPGRGQRPEQRVSRQFRRFQGGRFEGQQGPGGGPDGRIGAGLAPHRPFHRGFTRPFPEVVAGGRLARRIGQQTQSAVVGDGQSPIARGFERDVAAGRGGGIAVGPFGPMYRLTPRANRQVVENPGFQIGLRRNQPDFHVDPRTRVGQDDSLFDLKALKCAACRFAARQQDLTPRCVGALYGEQMVKRLARRRELDECQRLAVVARREKRAPGLTRVDRGDRGPERRDRYTEIGVFDDLRRRNGHGDRLFLCQRQAVDPEDLALAGQDKELRSRSLRRRVEVEHDLAPVGGGGGSGRQRKGLLSGTAVSLSRLVELDMEFGLGGPRSSDFDPGRQPVAHLGLQIPVDVGGGGRSGHPQGSCPAAEDLLVDGERLVAGPGAPAGSVGEGVVENGGPCLG